MQANLNGHAKGPVGHVIIPLPTDEELPNAVARTLAHNPPLNVARMFAITDDMFPAAMGFVRAVFTAKGIDIKLREIIILRCAHLLNSPCEWRANTALAKNAGVTAAEIAAVAKDGPVQGLDEAATLLCEATDELTLQDTLTDVTLRKLVERYDNAIAAKYVLIISWFNLLSRFLNGTRVPPDLAGKLKGLTSPI
jgi:alkylhydroperoxidase family enzyme